ncbi:MAG: PP2C family protein-serine/threonine phosphatase [Acidimicrobiales bacterium]
MTIDHRLSLRSRLLAVMALLAVMLLVIAVLAGLASASLNGAVDERLDRVYPASSTISRIRASVIDLETGERGYVITGDPNYLAPYTDALPVVQSGLETLRDVAPHIPGLDGQIDQLSSDLDSWRTNAAEPEIKAVRISGRFEGTRLVQSGEGKPLFDRVRVDLDGLQNVVDDASTANQARTRTQQRTLRNVLLGGVLAILALVAVLTALLTRWVTRPTKRLVDRVGVVADGDFREMVDVVGPPEFAALASAVDSMRQRILSELDEVERYNEALEQTGPVVQRLRLELESGTLVPRTGVEVVGRVLAAEGLLAGDFYDLIEMPAGRFAMVVADVSGHGHHAGILAIKVKYLLQAALQFGLGPSAALSWVADRLGDTGDMFVTCALVVIDPAAKRVEYASAGHSPGLLQLSDGDAPVVLSSTGPMIGPFPGEWRTDRTSYDGRGVMVVLCSDGLLEARASADALFGFDRFAEIVNAADSVAEIVEQSCSAARDHAGKRLDDDLTVVALRIDGTPQGA